MQAFRIEEEDSTGIRKLSISAVDNVAKIELVVEFEEMTICYPVSRRF